MAPHHAARCQHRDANVPCYQGTDFGPGLCPQYPGRSAAGGRKRVRRGNNRRHEERERLGRREGGRGFGQRAGAGPGHAANQGRTRAHRPIVCPPIQPSRAETMAVMVLCAVVVSVGALNGSASMCGGGAREPGRTNPFRTDSYARRTCFIWPTVLLRSSVMPSLVFRWKESSAARGGSSSTWHAVRTTHAPA